MVKDIKGIEIKEHDVLKNHDGVIGLCVAGGDGTGNTVLGIVNRYIGLNDQLDVFPDGEWKIIGNVKTGEEE